MSTEQVSQNMDATTGVSVENETVANDAAQGMSKHTHNYSDASPFAAPSEEKEKQTPDISALITKESRKAVEKLLKDAGITPEDNPEMQLREYKKWQDSQKTAFEKAQGDVQTLTKERDEALTKLQGMERNLLAVSKGIPADKADRYIKLAETYMDDSGDYDKALDAAIKDFPVAPIKPVPPTRAGTHFERGEPGLDMNTFLRTQK